MRQAIRAISLVLLALILIVGCSRPLPVLGLLPDFSLIDQTGRTIGKKDLSGKIWVASFIYTGCGTLCPLITQKMAELNGSLGSLASGGKIRLVSMTVDPENDTPERLAAYAKNYAASDSWFFLTGPTEEIQRTIIEGFRLSRSKISKEDILHSNKLVLVDREGRIRGYYEADPKGMKELIGGVKWLLRS